MNIARWKLAVLVAGVLALLVFSLPSPGDLAHGYLARREYEHARDAFRRQLERDPHDVQAWLGLAAVYEGLGDADRQILALEIAVRRFPGEREPLERLVDAHEWNRDMPGTIRALERLVQRVDASDAHHLHRLLSLYALTEQWDRAEVALRRLLALRPAESDIVDDMVLAARAANRLNAAIAFLEAEAERRPTDVAAQRRLAQVLEAVGEAERARARWRVVARLDPLDREARAALVATGAVASRAEIERLEGLRQARPDDATAREQLAALYRAAGETPRAIAVQRELVALRPGDVEALVALGELLVSDNRAAEAVPYYARAVQAAPARLPLAVRLAQLHEWTAQPAAALAVLERALAAHPADRQLAERVAALAADAGATDRALAVLDRLATSSSNDERYARRAIELLVAADRAPEAVPRLARLVERHPASLPDALRLAQLLEWTGQPARALAVLERAAAAHSSDRALAERVVSAAASAGHTDRALAVLDRLARQYPAAPKYPAEAVSLLVAASRPAEALPHQRRLVDLTHGAVPSQLRLAELYEWTGRERDAVAVYEVLDATGRLPDASLARLGELYRYQDRPADFLRVAERLLARQPGDEALRLAAADAAAGLERRPLALRLLRPLVEQRPRDAELSFRYIALAAQEGQLDEVRRLEARQAALVPGSALEFRIRVARLYVELGKHPEAIAAWQGILAAPPPTGGTVEIEARLALAQLHDWTGRPERALAEWEALARVLPRDVPVLRNLARRALAAGKNDLTLRAYRAILAQRPDDPEALKRTGQVLAWTGDAEGARRALERFNRLKGGDYEVHYQLGELYTAARDDAAARSEYERTLRLLPPREATR